MLLKRDMSLLAQCTSWIRLRDSFAGNAIVVCDLRRKEARGRR